MYITIYNYTGFDGDGDGGGRDGSRLLRPRVHDGAEPCIAMYNYSAVYNSIKL
jgi:hypothetical protein